MTKTLLDEFAMAALTGISSSDDIAKAAWAYELAEEMLIEKQRRCEHDFTKLALQHSTMYYLSQPREATDTCWLCGKKK